MLKLFCWRFLIGVVSPKTIRILSLHWVRLRQFFSGHLFRFDANSYVHFNG